MPNRAKNPIEIAAAPAENRRFLKNARLSIGWSVLISQYMNAATRAAPPTKPAIVSPSVQPRTGASMIE